MPAFYYGEGCYNCVGVNINDNGLIAYINPDEPCPSFLPYSCFGRIRTQYGDVVTPGSWILGKAVFSVYPASSYFLNNNNELVFGVAFTDGTQAIILATDTSASPTGGGSCSSTATSVTPQTTTFSASAQTVTLTAMVTSSGALVNGGTVDFTLSGIGGVVISAPVTNGNASVTYPIPAGTHAGVYSIQVVYSGTAGFCSSSGTGTLTILKATPTITWAKPAASVPGTFVYAPPAGTVLPVGTNQTLSATFTPTDWTDYNGATASVTIDVTAPPPAGGGGTPNLVMTRSLSRDPVTHEIIAVVTITNTGSASASNVQLTLADITCVGVMTCPIIFAHPGPISTTTPLPQSAGTIAAGASVHITVSFAPGTGLPAGASTTMTLSGTYTGGSFSSTTRVTLP